MLALRYCALMSAGCCQPTQSEARDGVRGFARPYSIGLGCAPQSRAIPSRRERHEPARPPERLIHRSAKHGGCLMSVSRPMTRTRARKGRSD
jgi:hypothetical protein